MDTKLLKGSPAFSFAKLILLGLIILSFQCRSARSKVDRDKSTSIFPYLQEIQLTKGKKGHFLNQRQAFSPDDQYLVFDNRNDDAKIGENGSVQIVNTGDGTIQTVYELENQTRFGPGAGAASFSPTDRKVIFIHGLTDADSSSPYGMTQRFAMQLDLDDGNKAMPVESRDVSVPFTAGALRGGSHAYAYSGDGKWVSYTYNDRVMELSSYKNPKVKDHRTVGAFLLNHPVKIAGETDSENFEGTAFSFLLAEVTSAPVPGSSQIMKAYEECWVGDWGYIKAQRQTRKRALAFLGDIVTKKGETITEVFIVDIPDDVEILKESVNPGGVNTLPSIPKGVRQRRLTFTEENSHPGVQGPRQWLRSSPDGGAIYFPMKDAIGVVQVAAVSPADGTIRLITTNQFSFDTSFSLSADGKYIAYGAKESLYISQVKSGITKKILLAPDNSMTQLSNINWSNSCHTLAYNRKVTQRNEAFYQIFVLDFSTSLF